MRYRLFGRSGLRVSEFILGAMIFGDDKRWSGRFGAEPDAARQIFDVFASAGGNMIDTANKYTEGQSERLVGELVGSDRQRFVLSTKYTLSVDESDPNVSGNHRKSLTRSLDQSLRRLRTDYIDVFWVHIWDADTPIDETVRALDDAVSAGKVLYVGISDSPVWVVRAGPTRSPTFGAGRRSLVSRCPTALRIGRSSASCCRWRGPLGCRLPRGRHSAVASCRASTSTAARSRAALTVRPFPITIGRSRAETLAVANELGVTSSQVALAWLQAQSPQIHPIIGARRVEQLTDNLAAADLELNSDALARLDAVSSVDPGFPTDMINDTRGFVYGAVDTLVEHR